MLLNPNIIVSKEILMQEEEFSIKKIFENVKNQLIEYFNNNEEELFKFVTDKVNALWESRVLTYTGYSYYVNI
ncbi:hypothetical protein ACR77J_07140 [Tissierella praeacuta]|uniref:hypothetical protein n=1 Tax=Tissierella praeacuta TaxID=43131 RepID=UPI003DA21D36